MNSNDPRFKNIGLNDPVSVTLPAHVWVSFYAAYLSTRWESWAATDIVLASQKEILDPLYVKESEARAQARRDEQHNMLRMFAGQPPEVPPHMGDEL